MRVLIGYDASPGSEFFVSDLMRAALPSNCEAIVLSVADIWVPPGIPEPPDPLLQPAVESLRHRADQALRDARSRADLGAQALRATFPTWSVRAEALADAPAWAIIARAESWPADLVVVGSHGRSAVGRVLFGSVSLKVLTELRCGVRIARHSPVHPNGAARVLIATDGSPDARAAVARVGGRNWPEGTQLRVVSVVDDLMLTAFHGSMELRAASATEIARRIAVSAAKALERPGLAVSTHVAEGDARNVILEQAEAWEADCVFVGARGLSRVERFLLGSVSTGVAMRAQCSVEVVHAPP